jgi:hypothetical protein
MPALYEAIRNKLSSKGADYDRAQAIAAATYRKMTGKGVKHETAPGKAGAQR